jgi:hypothetical protein
MSLSIAPITQGFDFNFFQIVTVSNGSFNHLSDLLIPFSTYTVTFQLQSGSGTPAVQYSLNGNTVHGDMTLNLPSANLTFQNRVISGIWFKGSGVVRVEAWAIR